MKNIQQMPTIFDFNWPPPKLPNETLIQRNVRLFAEAIATYPKAKQEPTMHDNVNHPKHYNSHPSGVECITITEHMSFNLGNAIKYLWRADSKGQAMDDLRKAKWYIEREIQKRLNDVEKQEVQE